MHDRIRPARGRFGKEHIDKERLWPRRGAAGGYPVTGPEETHRPAPPASPAAPGRRSGLRILLSTSLSRLLHTASHRRVRLQIAGIAAFALIALLSFAVLRPRTVQITADGDTTTVDSRLADNAAVVEQAGIDLQPGDRVEPLSEDTLAVRRATDVVVEADGIMLSVRSQAASIEELLSAAQVPLGPKDSVLRNHVFVAKEDAVAPPPSLASLAGRAAEPGRAVQLEVRRAVPFTLVEDEHELTVSSSRETIATALRDVGVRLSAGDRVVPSPGTELTAGLQIHVQRATTVVVTTPDGKLILHSLAGTVGGALKESAVALPANYRLDPPAATALEAGLVVHVVGIFEEQELEEERIESRTVYEPDPNLSYGATRVVPGQDGVRYYQYRYVYEDDRLVEQRLVDEWYDPEPIDTVVYYSTADAPAPPPRAPAVGTAGEAPDGLSVAGTIRVYATWYNAASAGRSSSDPAYGITATGVPVDRGIIAVDPSVIPLGTRMYIPGYGYGVAADTGGGISGNMIDLGYPDGVVPDWTSRWVDIYILGP